MSYLSKGHVIDQGRSGLSQVCHVYEVASSALCKLHQRSNIVSRRDDLHPAHRRCIICLPDARCMHSAFREDLLRIEHAIPQRLKVAINHHEDIGPCVSRTWTESMPTGSRISPWETCASGDDSLAVGFPQVLMMVRQLARVVHNDLLALQCALVLHSGRSDDKVQVILPFQALLHNLHVQQPQEAATISEAHGR